MFIPLLQVFLCKVASEGATNYLAKGFFISPLYDTTKGWSPEMYTLFGELLCCGCHHLIDKLLLLENAGEVTFA